MKKLLIILLFCVSVTGNATTYYLSPTGNDITGNGTIGTPWFTLTKAWTIVNAGDIIYLRGGTYSFLSQQKIIGKNGTISDTIKIFAYPDETPILTKDANYSTPVDYKGLIYFRGDYCYFKGLEISGFTQTTADLYPGFIVRIAHHNKFELINSHHNGLGMRVVNDCSDNLVLNCDFHHNYDPLTISPGAYGNADGFQIAYQADGGTNTVRGCRFYRNSDDGLDLWANEGNVIIDSCWSWHNGYREDGTINGGDGSGFKLGTTITSDGTTFQRTVSNCMSFYNRSGGIDQNGAIVKMYIYNNTAYHNGTTGFYFYIDLASVFRNNVSFNNHNNWVGTHSLAIVDHNSYDAGWQPTGPVISGLDFVSIDTTGVSGERGSNGSLPKLNFLKLASTSDLIDAGMNVGIPYLYSAPDLGAFEYHFTGYYRMIIDVYVNGKTVTMTIK